MGMNPRDDWYRRQERELEIQNQKWEDRVRRSEARRHRREQVGRFVLIVLWSAVFLVALTIVVLNVLAMLKSPVYVH